MNEQVLPTVLCILGIAIIAAYVAQGLSAMEPITWVKDKLMPDWYQDDKPILKRLISKLLNCTQCQSFWTALIASYILMGAFESLVCAIVAFGYSSTLGGESSSISFPQEED